MKKVLIVIGIIILIGIGSLVYVYQHSYTGDYYYTKVVNEGEKKIEKIDTGEKIASYDYTLKSVDEKGDSKTLSFSAIDRDKPLKMNAYLKLEYNNIKGVLNWEEVKKEEVPKEAMNVLK